MTARILIVDDILPNIKLLEAKLLAEYYEVITAVNGFECLELAKSHSPDLILLDVMMPGMDGYETCTKLKEDPEISHIPVVMVTALDQSEDKIRGLSCGADDFLTKPVEDLPLLARVKNLTRTKMMNDELRMRQNTQTRLGITSAEVMLPTTSNVLIVDSNHAMAQKMVDKLPKGCIGTIETDPENIPLLFKEKDFSLVVVNINFSGYDGLRICSNLRSSELSRQSCLMATGEDMDNHKLFKALDLGVNDFIKRPIDPNEFTARINTQLKRYYYSEQLRHNVEKSVADAIVDPMTGLYNRRYLNLHLDGLCQKAYDSFKSLSVAIADIDFFKSVNDRFGHDVGDQVILQFADRIKDNIRNFDMGVRYGGEEFIIVMPETDLSTASLICERIRTAISKMPFIVQTAEKVLEITCSIGVASLDPDGETPQNMIKRADAALYRGKQTGRNRVVVHKNTKKKNDKSIKKYG